MRFSVGQNVHIKFIELNGIIREAKVFPEGNRYRVRFVGGYFSNEVKEVWANETDLCEVI